jgi:hypothetical protein
MATETELIAWAITNADRLQLNVEHTTWIKEFFPFLTDAVVHVHFDGLQFDGWGWATNDQTALAKALAESLERIVLQQSKFQTSNGIAAHLDFARAAEAAKCELIERDLFLCHFYGKTPFVPFENRDLLEPVEKFSAWLHSKKAAIRFYHLGENGAICVIDCRGAGFGYSFGTAIKETPALSILASAIEAGRNVHRILSGVAPVKTLTLQEFNNIKKPQFSDHGKLTLDLEYADQISYLFDQADIRPHARLKNIEIERLYLHGELLEGCPLSFARASSASAQTLFLGSPTRSLLNLTRISEFRGKDTPWEYVSHLPHPMD